MDKSKVKLSESFITNDKHTIWLDNLVEIERNKKSGKCPYCQSENTDFNLEIIDHARGMGYGEVWCNNCRKAYQISRIRVEEEK